MRHFYTIILLLTIIVGSAHGSDDTELLSYEVRKPLVFSGFRGQEALKPVITVTFPSTYATLRETAVHSSDPDTLTYMQQQAALRTTADRIRYNYMVSHTASIPYLSWRLPAPPELHSTPDNTRDLLIGEIPISIDDGPAPVMIDDIRRINWLHNFDSGVQFSQAYLSPNWYQGGTNNLTLLVNLLWEVTLNEVYHPNLLFTNSISYKLGLYSTPQDTYHNYGISQDLFQWNMKTGIRASNKWFYSFTAQLKTQFINNYGENSLERKASFLSPGELNIGLGMTYATKNKRGTLKFNTSLSPISYNLKTCTDRHVDPTQFSIPAGKRFYNQVGSNAELKVEWTPAENISWSSRLFLFTNYQSFQGDWENTVNFSINRFLSTQIYLHMRYDTTSAPSDNWRYWMIKEILSFGFRYAFSTK